MSCNISPFGRSDSGTDVSEVTLSAEGQKLSVLTWGAVIRDLCISVGPIENRTVVLGLNNMDDYLKHSPHFGAIAGRCANRIAGGRFALDDDVFEVTKNQNNLHHLHGGRHGFGKRNWDLVSYDDASVTLQINSHDGDEGYPGALKAECTYQLQVKKKQVALSVLLTATTTKPTLVNLAQHSYFNLDETTDIRRHKLQINAKSYLPTDPNFIPTGEIRDVDGTAFDFQNVRLIRQHDDPNAQTYDNNFNIADRKQSSPRCMATLMGSDGLSMDVVSDQPGLQFYDGARVNVPAKGLLGEPYGAFSGVCLEPQIWPNSPNNSHFPQAVLRPGETYRQETIYVFRAS